MKRTITRNPVSNRLIIRLGWFVGIWGASVAVLSCVAYVLHKIILG
jgi:Protein of unknown function (DUF2474)